MNNDQMTCFVTDQIKTYRRRFVKVVYNPAPVVVRGGRRPAPETEMLREWDMSWQVTIKGNTAYLTKLTE
jgi:DhnA family fructose-bisphosphate aldolase class Ia